MQRMAVTAMGIGLGLALVWVAGGRGFVPAAAEDAGPAGPVAVSAAAAPAAAGYAPFEAPAGREYRLANLAVESYMASLAPLWTFDGDVGTYGDGGTRIRVQTAGGQVSGVEVLNNASGITDSCLTAQLMYGVAVEAAGVEAACAGMWTQAWAQQQAEALNEGP